MAIDFNFTLLPWQKTLAQVPGIVEVCISCILIIWRIQLAGFIGSDSWNMKSIDFHGFDSCVPVLLQVLFGYAYDFRDYILLFWKYFTLCKIRFLVIWFLKPYHIFRPLIRISWPFLCGWHWTRVWESFKQVSVMVLALKE